MKDILKSVFSDILEFDGDTASSHKGSIRLELRSDKESAMWLALPDPAAPTVILLAGVAAAFLNVAAPEYPEKDVILQVASYIFGTENINHLTRQFEGGAVDISYDRDAFVYQIVVRRD